MRKRGLVSLKRMIRQANRSGDKNKESMLFSEYKRNGGKKSLTEIFYEKEKSYFKR